MTREELNRAMAEVNAGGFDVEPRRAEHAPLVLDTRGPWVTVPIPAHPEDDETHHIDGPAAYDEERPGPRRPTRCECGKPLGH